MPALEVKWPDFLNVSPRQPLDVTVALEPLTDLSVAAAESAIITATLSDPGGVVHAILPLDYAGGYRYASATPAILPLDAMSGTWHIAITVTAAIEVRGPREFLFYLTPLTFHDLGTVLPEAAHILVPADFKETAAQGDDWAGGRTWEYENSELALWWAPGPTEPLRYDPAWALVEATYEPNRRGELPEIVAFEKATWNDKPAFLFRETWPGRSGGESTVWVIQGKDYRLYLLRTRSLGGRTVNPLVTRVADSLTVE